MEFWLEGDCRVNWNRFKEKSHDLFSMSVCLTEISNQKSNTNTDPLLMNAFNTVNLSAACVVTSTEYARQLQIPEDKWIYPLGGAGFKEKDNCAFCLSFS